MSQSFTPKYQNGNRTLVKQNLGGLKEVWLPGTVRGNNGMENYVSQTIVNGRVVKESSGVQFAYRIRLDLGMDVLIAEEDLLPHPQRENLVIDARFERVKE
jgi:hypothetical protein